MEQRVLPPITSKDRAQYQAWWQDLSDNWKKAFNQTMFNKGEITDDLTDEELHDIWHSNVFRAAGPTAPFPNLTFEVGDLSGVKALHRLEVLVVINSGLTDITALKKLTNLKSLFIYENNIKRLNGIEKLTGITELHIHENPITSLEPLKGLTNLKKVTARDLKIKSLKGIGKKHVKNLKDFYVLPNEKLPFKEVNKMQNKIGIECKKI